MSDEIEDNNFSDFHLIFSDEQIKKLASMERLCLNMRGTFIHRFIVLEYFINIIITQYFCTSVEKQSELAHRIVATKMLTFENKQAILGFIISNSYTSFLEAHPDFITTITDLQEFIPFKHSKQT